MHHPRLRETVVERQAVGVQVQPEHAERGRRPRHQAAHEPQRRGAAAERLARVAHGAQPPGAHAQRLAAAHPVEDVVPGDHREFPGAVHVEPNAECPADCDVAWRKRQRCRRIYHEQRAQQDPIIDQRRETSAEARAAAAGHGAARGSGAAVAAWDSVDAFAPTQAADAPPG